MLKKLSKLTLVCAALAGMPAGTAHANSNFCGEVKNCKDITVNNRSSALVTSVKITQEKTGGDCTLDERNFSQNLNGLGGSEMRGDSITLQVNTDCKYKIKYKTTDGCTGDKTTHLSPSDFAAGKSYTQLKSACGALKVKTGPP